MAIEAKAPDSSPWPMATTVRLEQPGDVSAIHAVHVASFPTDAEARLVGALRASERLFLSFVAAVDDEVVGHAGFSPVSLAGATDGIGLGPVAVLPDYRRRGIAEQIVREGLSACERSGRGFAVVLGDPDYYGRFGFEPASHFELRDEYGGGVAFQALAFRAGSIPTGGGLVRYSPEFAAFTE